jgi:ABC-type methionine transport system ATPase subunit
MAKQSHRYWVTFPAERVKRPLILELSKKFDLIFDLRSANVTDKVGIIALELTGDQKILAAAVKWLRKNRVEVDPIELDVVEG